MYRFETDQSDSDSRRYVVVKGSWGLIILRALARKSWLCLLPLGIFFLIYFRIVPAMIILPIFFGVIILIICFLILLIRSRVTHELEPVSTIKSNACYQHKQMLELAWAQPVARLYPTPVYYQPREGYCGHATINNVLQSVPGSKTWIRLPASPHGITLGQMADYWTALSGRNPAMDNSIQISSVTMWNAENATFESFLEEMKLLNNPRYRFLCNFLRGPLFFSDPKQLGNVLRRLLMGHWSPIVAYLPPNSGSTPVMSDSSGDTLEDKSKEKSMILDLSPSSHILPITQDDGGFVLLLDVNETYGPFLVSAKRLFGAIKTRDLGNGHWRGLVRIELRE